MTELDVDDYGLSTTRLGVAGGGDEGGKVLTVDCDCRFCFGDDKNHKNERDSSFLLRIFGFGRAL